MNLGTPHVGDVIHRLLTGTNNLEAGACVEHDIAITPFDALPACRHVQKVVSQLELFYFPRVRYTSALLTLYIY